MDRMEHIRISVFTDPMMGLSYEAQPVLDRVKETFGERLSLDYVMAGLVRDVSDFMNVEECSLPPKEGIARYCRRLADIYRSEEPLGGLPIRMEGFCLFDENHRSSYPLNIAYHAAKLVSPEKAEEFLIRLRYATVYETRPTTHKEEILRVVRLTGISEEKFLASFTDGSAEAAFEKDLAFVRSLGIHSLPAYLVQCGKKATLVRALADYDTFVRIIDEMTENN